MPCDSGPYVYAPVVEFGPETRAHGLDGMLGRRVGTHGGTTVTQA
jgi:hypothetical protein